MDEKKKNLAALAISIPEYKKEIKFGCFIIRKRTQEELLNYYNSKRVVLDDYGNVRMLL